MPTTFPNFVYFLGFGTVLFLAGAGVTYSYREILKIVPPPPAAKAARFSLKLLMIFGMGLILLAVLDYFGAIERKIQICAEREIMLNYDGALGDFTCTVWRDGKPKKLDKPEFEHVVIAPANLKATAYKYHVQFPGRFATEPCVTTSVHGLSGVFSRFGVEAQDVHREGFTLVITLWEPNGTPAATPFDISKMHASMLDQIIIDWVATPQDSGAAGAPG